MSFLIMKNKKIVAECETKEEGKKKGKEIFDRSEKGDDVTLLKLFPGSTVDEEGNIHGKWSLYEYWY